MSAPDLRRALAAHTEEEDAEAIAALCPRAAVLVVAGHFDMEPMRCWCGLGPKDPAPARVRLCNRVYSTGRVTECRCCDAHACEGSL